MGSAIKMQKLEIPYYSQRNIVTDLNWKDKSCGAVNVKMVLEFYGIGVQIDKIIKEMLLINGYDKINGWKHNSLAMLLRNHGVNAYLQEFRSHNIDTENSESNVSKYEVVLVDSAILKIKKEIYDRNPVIVSVLPNFTTNKEYHTIVISGIKEENGRIAGLYYNDSAAENEEKGKGQFTTIERFLKYWRKFSIFTYKPHNT